MFDVYIAGAMTGREVSDVLLERAEAKALLSFYGLTYYDPAADEGLDKLDPYSVISNTCDLPRMRSFVGKDLCAITQCRSVLNITGDLSSEGSLWEMAYAKWKMNIPVILVAPQRLSGKKMTFTNVLVDHIYSYLRPAVKRLKEML